MAADCSWLVPGLELLADFLIVLAISNTWVCWIHVTIGIFPFIYWPCGWKILWLMAHRMHHIKHFLKLYTSGTCAIYLSTSVFHTYVLYKYKESIHYTTATVQAGWPTKYKVHIHMCRQTTGIMKFWRPIYESNNIYISRNRGLTIVYIADLWCTSTYIK